MPIVNNEAAIGGTSSALNIQLFTPFEETVETVQESGAPAPGASLNYSDPFYLPSIKVTFDGVEYTCKGEHIKNIGMIYGGHPSDEDPFIDYPFIVICGSQGGSQGNHFMTETAGTYTVRIEPSDESVKLADVVNNGRSVNAALMRFLMGLNVFPDLSDSNAMLIDKISKAFFQH